MPEFKPVPGQWCEGRWAETALKRRHFVVDGRVLKLFGRRGKTFKGQLNLLAVTALRPAADAAASAGTFELQVRTSRSHTQTYLMAPDHSHAELFLAVGNAVPSHATSDDLFRMHLRSRPATSGAALEYRLGKTLGTGTFGKVKLAQRVADGHKVAIKCLNRSRIVFAAQGGRLAREIQLLRLLNHPNVIRLHEVLHTPSQILMVMDYVSGGDLLEVLNTQPRFKEEQARQLFTQICHGVSFCHSLGVAHRDLKPENILLERKADGAHRIRLADFGLATLMRAGEMLSTACGSPHYVAPEILKILNFDATARYDGRKADVWSLGVILYVLLCYKLPFEAESTVLLYKKIRRGSPSFPAHLSPAARDLLTRMLKVSAEQRTTLDQAVDSEWLRAEVEAPVLSLLVDAVVDHSFSEMEPSRTAGAARDWRDLQRDRLPSISGARLNPLQHGGGVRHSLSDVLIHTSAITAMRSRKGTRRIDYSSRDRRNNSRDRRDSSRDESSCDRTDRRDDSSCDRRYDRFRDRRDRFRDRRDDSFRNRRYYSPHDGSTAGGFSKDMPRPKGGLPVLGLPVFAFYHYSSFYRSFHCI
mmetsp:Transcript_27258/g.63690  ORF Transcript_27258/g.63690 Transcript_27258/m.63690 type:complete len:586 (-) Transcript_27258:245-2002(-)